MLLSFRLPVALPHAGQMIADETNSLPHEAQYCFLCTLVAELKGGRCGMGALFVPPGPPANCVMDIPQLAQKGALTMFSAPHFPQGFRMIIITSTDRILP